MADNRTFTDDEEPPFGERIELVNAEGVEIVWNGKRWCERGYERSLTMHEAWPPSNQSYVGPWFELGVDTPVSTDPTERVEYALPFRSGDMHVRCPDPEVERVYPLADWIAHSRQNGGKVYRRRVVIIEDWEEVTEP